MTTKAAPTMENQWATVRTIQSHIVIEHMVAPECLTQSINILTGEVLLPVEPPEVDTLTLAGTDNVLKHIVVKAAITQVPGHTLGLFIQSHILAQIIEEILIIVHTISWVQIQRYLQTVLVHPVDKTFGIGNSRTVPSPTGPPLGVPVHIKNHHVHRDVEVLYIVHNLHELIRGVTLVFAIPIAQHIEWRHGLATGHLDVIAQRLLILMTIA